jgi:hypothetical protein
VRTVEQAFHVDVVAATLADQTAARVGKDVHAAVVHRAQDALGLAIARQVELRMHRADHEIQLVEHAVRQVQPTVFEDVELDQT